ncbi:hypothetical protein ACFQ3J_15310 [Paenibacillus provencensis]|uniref:Uncharacterized protein n=1 Tax=Paenibacillus provencensis TaxID=441151 RepID=A0ABW3Q627_9BACL|nr:hypothetical protein [Paenibacillus sp. MER 78]MCM3127998.1 hypothetical protein [Paenibacillus sp. MER 78]
MNNGGLVIDSISKSFGTYTALQHINVTIPKGKFTCLLGPSGCGRDTAQAASMSVLIVMLNLAVRGGYEVLTARLRRKITAAWQKR